jgi:hypothetical protein
MVHSAYDSFELVPNFNGKIESIESYGSKLLLGCSDGSLRIYSPETEFSDHSKPYTLEKNLANFAMNPVNTVFDAKRLIGRRVSDASVQSDTKLRPFKVTAGPGEKPMIGANYKGEDKQFAVEEISSMVLVKRREKKKKDLLFQELHTRKLPSIFYLSMPLTRPIPDPTRFFILDWAWVSFVCSFALIELS